MPLVQRSAFAYRDTVHHLGISALQGWSHNVLFLANANILNYMVDMVVDHIGSEYVDVDVNHMNVNHMNCEWSSRVAACGWCG